MPEETQTQTEVSTKPALKPPVVLPTKIELTERAVAEARRIMDKQNMTDTYIRLGVKGGGCSGLSYTMTFDQTVSEKDKIFDYGQGVKAAVDVKSYLFLRGMILDYSDDLIGGGFKFENPNAKRTCSCGSSFSA